MQLTPKLDVHTHTIVSGHAYSTIQEMAQEAANQKLQILGITEHAPSIPGTCDPIYFRNMHVVPREIYGIKLLLGAELNILDKDGTLDLDENYYRILDLRIAGIHALCWDGGTREENTQGMLNVIRNPWVQIISHPGDGTADLNFKPLVIASGEQKTLLEINNSSLIPSRGKVQAYANNLEILRLSRKYGVPVILGSDAHVSFSIADYKYLWKMIDEANFPKELIMNYWPDEFLAYIS
ncbi:MAG: phosphatase [Bacteroidaceae bacterium]|nr:phosphatase [Bacteroidaceae bacterium]MBR5466121.1 phosphatase [Bacteroidaceae bacterium]